MMPMKFKFLGIEIYVSFLFAAILVIMLATDRTGLLLPSLFAIFVHEAAHLFAMWIVDCTPKKIRLIPASIQIIRRFGISEKNEIFVALLGPIANLILFIVLYINYLSFHNVMTLYYSIINLLVGAFNLLPVIGLDGGTVLLEILSKKGDYTRAVRILKTVTFIICAITLAIAIILLLKGKFNISAFILAIYFFIMGILKM